MKKVIAILGLVLISSSAFAMHAYGEDTCMTKLIDGTTLEIGLANGMPADPHIIRDGSEVMHFANFEQTTDAKEDLNLVQSKDENVLERKTSNGCFEGTQRSFTRSAVVSSASNYVVKKYALRKGMKLNFVCYGSFSYPTGKKCGL